jgi:serine/threonine-protein kinase
MEALPQTHQVDEVFGPFRLERALGRGAAAEVWQAVEIGSLGFTKRQALKLLRPPPGEMESQKKALINEARVCGRLKHPGVVDVYKVGEHQGELYIAMEFVDGPDLNTLLDALRRRQVIVPVGVCLDVALDLLEALDHAHNASADDGQPLRIVHRDLKPSNVLVDRRGVLKISDWGLVKSTLNIESTTRGIVKGTPGYIAPEVWGGTRDFKPAADLFAVGAMLYELIVSERLFQGRNLARIAEQVARRKPEEEAARVRERCPELEPVLARLLQRAPANRYTTAADVMEAMRPIREKYPGSDTIKKFLREIHDLVEEICPSTGGVRGSSTGSSSALPARGAPQAESLELDADASGASKQTPAQLGPAASRPSVAAVGGPPVGETRPQTSPVAGPGGAGSSGRSRGPAGAAFSPSAETRPQTSPVAGPSAAPTRPVPIGERPDASAVPAEAASTLRAPTVSSGAIPVQSRPPILEDPDAIETVAAKALQGPGSNKPASLAPAPPPRSPAPPPAPPPVPPTPSAASAGAAPDDGAAGPVGATRAMPASRELQANELPAEAADTLPPGKGGPKLRSAAGAEAPAAPAGRAAPPPAHADSSTGASGNNKVRRKKKKGALPKGARTTGGAGQAARSPGGEKAGTASVRRAPPDGIRPPPPTSAVLVLVGGLLILLMGVLAVLFLR